MIERLKGYEKELWDIRLRAIRGTAQSETEALLKNLAESVGLLVEQTERTCAEPDLKIMNGVDEIELPVYVYIRHRTEDEVKEAAEYIESLTPGEQAICCADTFNSVVDIIDSMDVHLDMDDVKPLSRKLFEIRQEAEQADDTEHDQSIKTDAGKLQPTLVEPSLIREVAKVRAYGVDKYGDRENWSKVEPERYKDALYRHLLAYLDGELLDKESELPHLSHMACNLMFLIELAKRGKL